MASGYARKSIEKVATETTDSESLRSHSLKSSVSEMVSESMRSRAWTRRSTQERRSTADKSSKHDSKLTPFYLRWSFGNTTSIPVFNLTRASRPLLFYASCHAGVLYDYKAKEMRLLQGHHNPVSSIASDNTGKWLVTADAGPDNAVIVWDSELCLPVNTLFNTFPKVGIRTVGMSPDAKYLITVSDETTPTIACWLWTYGKEVPDATATLKDDFGTVNHIIFNPGVPHKFMVTSEKNILFLCYDTDEMNLLVHEPEPIKRKIGHFIESLYMPELFQAITCTNKGFVLVWGHGSANPDSQTTYRKRLLKEIRLQKDGITCIRSVLTNQIKDSDEDDIKRVVVTGNTRGHIRFYDQQLRILFWCQNFTLDSIVSIDFHLEPRKFQIKDPLDIESMSTFLTSRSSIDKGGSTQHAAAKRVSTAYSTGTSVTSSPRLPLVQEDKSEEYETIYASLVPSDASLQRTPFVVRDFVVSTTTSQIGLVNFLDNELVPILFSSKSNVSAIDVHPELPYLIMGNELGYIRMYNYLSKELLIETRLPEEHTTDTAYIRCLQFAPSGMYLVCGMLDGALWFLEATLLKPLFTPPTRHVKNAITKICITLDSQYIAHIDDDMCTSLYRSPDQSGSDVVYMGRQRAHYMPVVDVMFGEDEEQDDDDIAYPRLFSLGQDKVIVEYDVASSQPDELRIFNMERIEQCANPICMAWYPMFTCEQFILTSNTEFKYKILNDTTKMCRKTTLTALYDSPVCHMKILGSLIKPDINKSYMVFATDQQIGIQMLPLDGNPFKCVGMVGHPHKIQHLRVSSDDKYLFTVGGNDLSVLMWQINVRSVDVMNRIGGESLSPFYCLIEGGQNGWLFQEMQDLFYYAQILHQGESMPTKRQVSDKIPLCELPDLMRAIGFYPTEYEIENMVHEVHYSKFAETGQEEEHINYEDFVRLYINHHPARGIAVDTIKRAFDTFADIIDGENSLVTRDTFLSVLQERGECFSKEQAVKYMNILVPGEYRKSLVKDPDMPGESEHCDVAYQLIPQEFNFTTFIEDILGITYATPDLKAGGGITFTQ